MSPGASFWLGCIVGLTVGVILTVITVRKIVALLVEKNRDLRIRNALLTFQRDLRDRRRTVIPIEGDR